MSIKKRFWLPLIALSLTGCSGSPDADDIKATLEQGWASCSGAKFQDLKKTNGVDRGKNYEMAVSYSLEVRKDLTAEEAWKSDGLCPVAMVDLLYAYRKTGQMREQFGAPLKKGDLLKISDTYTMVKSEKGWIKE